MAVAGNIEAQWALKRQQSVEVSVQGMAGRGSMCACGGMGLGLGHPHCPVLHQSYLTVAAVAMAAMVASSGMHS